jgi:hypothetical protein
MVVLLSTIVSRYHNCCIDGDTSPEYFEYTLVLKNETRQGHVARREREEVHTGF